MPHGDFVWCDLSTFRVEDTKRFYAELLGWRYDTAAQPDGTPYHLASTADGEAAAVFEMPEKFQKIGLPSFWMSYIEVDDIVEAVAQAGERGGKVEVGPIAFGEGASIALIRDPLGAGFTVYQGNELKPRRASAPPGHMTWNALYVSDAQAVVDFYEALFSWRISKNLLHAGVFQIRGTNGDEISEIHQLTDEVRGKHQFWGVHFTVADLSTAKSQIVGSGGEILYEDHAAAGPTLLAKDPDGAAFFLRQSEPGAVGSREQATRTPGSFKWKTALALAAIWLAVVTELNWVWGVLFIMWTVPALRSGQTFFVEPIARDRNPGAVLADRRHLDRIESVFDPH